MSLINSSINLEQYKLFINKRINLNVYGNYVLLFNPETRSHDISGVLLYSMYYTPRKCVYTSKIASPTFSLLYNQIMNMIPTKKNT